MRRWTSTGISAQAFSKQPTKALARELRSRVLDTQRQLVVPVDYKGARIGAIRVDFLVEGKLVVELKAVETILPIHRAQLRSYLKAGGFKLGLLINFNVLVLRDGVARVIDT